LWKALALLLNKSKENTRVSSKEPVDKFIRDKTEVRVDIHDELELSLLLAERLDIDKSPIELEFNSIRISSLIEVVTKPRVSLGSSNHND
jgi:hypothetical protein